MSFGPGGWDPFRRAQLAQGAASMLALTILGYAAGELLGRNGVVLWLFVVSGLFLWGAYERWGR